MKFLCDVHISFKIVNFLTHRGFEALHVNHTLDGSVTKDPLICQFVDENDYTLITKDNDFINSFFARNTPKKLIKINLGNISNQKLMKIFSDNIQRIVDLDRHENFLLRIDSDDLRLTYL